MTAYLVRRLVLMVPTVFIISIISFVIIELPPGDFVSMQLLQMESSGVTSEEQIDALRARFGMDRPWHERYTQWIIGFFRGDFGYSLAWQAPVRSLIGDRLTLTIAVSGASLLFTYLLAIPIGLISAVKQYSPIDYIATFIGFLGLSIPNFLLALVLMYFSFRAGGSVGGLFSPEYAEQSWSFAKFANMLTHLWIPVIVVGTAGTAGTIRGLRNNMLDELNKPYVVTARAKGLRERRIILKYPFRYAINPMMSTIGWLLPQLVSGTVITAVVLGLPTTGPLFLRALQQQDMYLAGFFVMFYAILTVIGTFLSDILLSIVDPRIRYS